ncbi:nucleotidyltransferase family protein [Acidimangrovimonas pyrenivorans]|uniref:Nucleotidyltransferase family protein n=1 Tax=Acidimangrovimonas pyrenivorans TaxID=2030798 RepID=A0ABV7ALM8_9RHOB
MPDLMPRGPEALMLFAAGRGTRMGALTADRPKPLIEVAGRPLIDHALDLVSGAGIARTVVNTHYFADQLAAHLAGRELALSHEPELLETGGGLRAALPLLGPGPVFTLNSDAVWTGSNPLAQLRAAWDPARMDALLLLVSPGAARGRVGGGDFSLDAEGRLHRGGPMIYVGAQILRPDGLAGIDAEVFSLNLLWDRIAAAGRLFGVIHDGFWCDVGRPEGIAEAEAMLREADHV